jgi:hypothetical protein
VTLTNKPRMTSLLFAAETGGADRGMDRISSGRELPPSSCTVFSF